MWMPGNETGHDGVIFESRKLYAKDVISSMQRDHFAGAAMTLSTACMTGT